MPKAWDHLEEDVRRETEMTDFSVVFFPSWLLLSLEMPTPYNLILLHLSICLTAWMVSFAWGNWGLIHLERAATMCVGILLGRKECQLLCLNDWQSLCDYSLTTWYPVCFLSPAVNWETSCVFAFAVVPLSLEENCWKGVLIHSSSYGNHYLICGTGAQGVI